MLFSFLIGWKNDWAIFKSDKYSLNEQRHFMKTPLIATILMMAIAAPSLALAKTVDSPKGFKANTKGYPIQAIIDQWGSPTNMRGNWHQWRSCHKIDDISSQYHGNGAWKSVQNQICCVQSFKTDKQGVINNYRIGAYTKTASGLFSRDVEDAYCFSDLNYHQIHQNYQKK